MSEFKFPTESKALKSWVCDEDFYEEGFELEQEDADPGKHSSRDVTYILKHTATGRFLEVCFSSDYNWGPDEYSFTAREVWPKTVTVTTYSGTKP